MWCWLMVAARTVAGSSCRKRPTWPAVVQRSSCRPSGFGKTSAPTSSPTDVRDAVLTERAALDVLIEWAGAPREELSFLGYSGGGALGAILCAVEPRLSRIGIFGYGAGTLARSARAREIRAGRAFAGDVAADGDWLDAARFVGVERSARLFVQHGRSDRTVPIIQGRALFDAAAFPKLWVEYDWDHGLDADPQARKDRADFVST